MTTTTKTTDTHLLLRPMKAYDTGEPAEDNNIDLRTGDHYTGTVKRLMEFCGFIGTNAGDFYFGMDDCVGGTEFSKLRMGDRVDFIVSKMPRASSVVGTATAMRRKFRWRNDGFGVSGSGLKFQGGKV